jgi:hypothetical protein
MKKSGLRAIILSVLVFVSSGCGRVLYADGPYLGKVIDKQTREPIEGAAVVALWMKETPFVGHYMVRYHDAQETVTDQQGNFTIPGLTAISFNPLAKVREPSFTIFKPGYTAYRRLVFKPQSAGIIEVFEEGDRMVYALERLKTREERMRNLDGLDPAPRCRPQETPESSLCLPGEKFPNLLRLKNIEQKNLNLNSPQRSKGAVQ